MTQTQARGKTLHLTRKEVVTRALSQIGAVPGLPPGNWPADAGGRPIGYRLEGGFNGGFDPEAPHCASWSYGGRAPTADCVGFVLWASGIDRMQPGFKGSRDEWLNCASILDDAAGIGLYSKFTTTPKPGDWVLDRGHISMLVRVAGTRGSNSWKHLVVDCSPRHDATRQAAINTGPVWSPACRIVAPTFYQDT